jgi:hypothetical protein
MEQVEDVQRYRKVTSSKLYRVKKTRLEDGSFTTAGMVRQAFAEQIGADNTITKLSVWYDEVDNTIQLGWIFSVKEFEWTERKPKAVAKPEPKVRKVRQVATHYQNGKPIIRTKGKVVSKRRGAGGTLATKVAVRQVEPLTESEIQARRDRLVGGFFVGATYLGK